MWQPGSKASVAARANWARTRTFVWVRATKDSVVWPNEAEQWGALSPDYPANKTVAPMPATAWYLEDPFGLASADARGANQFEEFEGNHIRFSQEELTRWVDKYFTE